MATDQIAFAAPSDKTIVTVIGLIFAYRLASDIVKVYASKNGVKV